MAASRTYVIEFRSQNAQTAAKDVKDVADASKKLKEGAAGGASSLDLLTKLVRGATGGLGGLNSAVGLAGGGVLALASALAVAGAGVVKVSDDYLKFTNQLRLVTTTQGDFILKQAELFAIAQVSRSGLNDVGEAYVKIKFALEGVGIGGQEALGVTDTLFESLTAMGASSSEATSLLTQLAVSFEQNTITGRQFRSLTGENVLLVNTLAKGVGLTGETMKQLAADGKLSAETLVRAFEIAGPKIHQILQGIQPTNTQQFTKLANTAEYAVGDKPATITSKFLGGLNNITGQDKPENSIIGYILNGNAKLAMESLLSISSQLSGPQKVFLDNLKQEQKVRLDIADAERHEGVFAAIKDKLQDSLYRKGILSQTELNHLLEDGRTITDLNAKGFKVITDEEFNKRVLTEKNIALDQQVVAYTQQIGGYLQDNKLKLDAIEVVRDRINLRTEAEILKLQVTNELLAKRADLESAKQHGINTVEARELTNSGVSSETVKAYEQGAGAAKGYKDEVNGINNALEHGYISQAKSIELLNDSRIKYLETERDVGAGFERGFLKVENSINDFASDSEKVVTDAFNGMNDSLVKFVQTGKLSFSDLTQSLLADMTKLILKQAESAILGAALGAFTGGASSLLGSGSSAATGAAGTGLVAGPPSPRAAGGPVTAGSLYRVGEHGPELFSPGLNGTIIPNGKAMGSQVHVTVVNASDPNEIAQHLNDPKNDHLVLNVLRRNRSAVKQVTN